jgi:two-component system CheB/CheR fusion protein
VQVKSVTARDHTRTALVIFIEGSPIEKPASGESVTADEGQSFNIAIQQLHDELNATRARLKASHEEEEAANEELRAANEELQSINEEYRSTAEELETSKEELQSFNEELQTLNHELKAKLESISRAHNDLQNLMAATDVGTLFSTTACRSSGSRRASRRSSTLPPATKGGRSRISPIGWIMTDCPRTRRKFSGR